jgi:hypothetical protein
MRCIRQGNKWLCILLVIIIAGALVQTGFLLFAGELRSQMSLGANFEWLVSILGGQIFTGALIGQTGYEYLISHHMWTTAIAAGITGAGLLVIFFALLRAPAELRLFIFYAALIVIAALISPQASDSLPQWEVLARPGVGGRYWFMPMLCFICAFVWILHSLHLAGYKLLVVITVSIMTTGVLADWEHPPYVDFHFERYAYQFQVSPSGAEIVVPINPPGWFMSIMKN